MLIANLPHSILSAVFERLGTDPKYKSDGDAALDGTEARLHKELHFAVLRGSRFKKSLALLHDVNKMTTLMILALALEPLRYFTDWLMKRA